MGLDSVESVVGRPANIGALLKSALNQEPLRDSLQRLCELAAQALDVPVTFVSLVHEGEILLISGIGLPEAATTLRAMSSLDSFCRHTVKQQEPLVIDDAARHPLTRDLSAVTRLSFLAYLGVPLRARDGNAIGAFCAVDLVQRPWKPDEVEIMRALTQSVSTELELRALRTLKLDAMERSAAQRRSEFLVEVDRVLSLEGPLEQRLEEAAVRTLSLLGDYCVIDVEYATGASSRAAAIHVDPKRTPEVRALPELASSVDRPAQSGASDDKLILPIRYHDALMGFLALGRHNPESAYSEQEKVLAHQLADRIGIAISVSQKDRAMRDAVRQREELISVASHELRTPLTALQLRLDSMVPLVAQKEVELERLQRSLEAARQQCTRLAKLHDTLLDLAVLTTDRPGLNLELIDLTELIHDVVGRFEPQAAEYLSPIHVQGAARVCVRADRTRMEQVVSNLLSNALKYGRGKPVEVRIELQGRLALLKVSDHGIGIASEALQRIFGRFERAVPKHHFGGLGIGLYVAHQIVHAHGGRIWAESEPGKGSTFTVSLCAEDLPSGGADELRSAKSC